MRNEPDFRWLDKPQHDSIPARQGMEESGEMVEFLVEANHNLQNN